MAKKSKIGEESISQVKTGEVMESSSRLESVLAGEVIAKIQKTHGDSILMKASDFGVMAVPRIKTNIFSLDYALGGGFPAGRFNVVYGPKSAAKTTTLLKAVAFAQKCCARCWTLVGDGKCQCGDFLEPVIAYLDVEGALDLVWAATLGVSLEKMIISVPEFAEQALDIGEALIRNGCDLLVLDSLAFLTPQKEIEELTGKDTMGVQARLIGRGVRKFVMAMNQSGNEQNGRRPTVLATNQIRMKLGVMFGNPETQPGGLAPGFATSTEVRMWPGKYEMDDVTGKPLKVIMNFKVEKNKCAGSKIEGEWKLILSDTETKKKGEIFDEDVMVSLAERIGFIEKVNTSNWTCMGETYRGRSLIERRLLTEPDFKANFADVLMRTLLEL
jgi:recombination protein RecA